MLSEADLVGRKVHCSLPMISARMGTSHTASTRLSLEHTLVREIGQKPETNIGASDFGMKQR